MAEGVAVELEEVVRALSAIDSNLSAIREAAVESVPVNSALVDICAQLAAEIEAGAEIDKLDQLCGFEDFASQVVVPPTLLTERKRAQLAKFVLHAHRGVQSRLLAEACARADVSDAVIRAQEEAVAARSALIWQHKRTLARSDHEPIRATLRGLNWQLRVCSHNVQELVRDGVSTYVSSMPFVGVKAERGADGVNGAGKLLMSAILDYECVRQQQLQAVLHLLANELGETRGTEGGSGTESGRNGGSVYDGHTSQADAVLLQEVSTGLLAEICAVASSRGWHVHHSLVPPESAVTSKPGSCCALTCVVTRSASSRSLTIEPDIVVDVPRLRSSGFRTRRFATVTLGSMPVTAADGAADNESAGSPSLVPPVTLVSVHVLHSPDSIMSGADRQPTNAEHIWQAVVEIAATLAHRIAAGGIILAVGDFNGPLCFCPAESAAPPLNPSAPERADLVRQVPQRLRDVRRSGIGASESVLIDENVDSYASEALPCNGFCAISPDSATQFGTPLAVDGAVLLSSERLDLQVVADPPA